MAPPRVDHKIYSRGRSAHSAQRVYEYTGQWLRVEKGIDATRGKRKRISRQEDSDDESEWGSESEESGSDSEPLPEIHVCNSEDSTSDSSSDDDDADIDEQSPQATKTRPANRQLIGVQNNQHLPTPSLSPEAARKRLFDGLDEHYRRAVRRAAMAGKRQFQAKPQVLLTPPTSGDSVPPNNKGGDRVSGSSPLSELPANPDAPCPKKVCTRAGTVSLPNRPGQDVQLESPLRRESAATIPDSAAGSDESSRDTAPASPASVSSSCDEHEHALTTAPATAAPPSIKSSTVVPATTRAPTLHHEDKASQISTDPASATGRPRRNIQLPSRIAHSQPQSAVAHVELSRKRPREPTFETREHPMSLASSPDTDENSALAMESLARNSPVPAISTQAVSVQNTVAPPDLFLRREKSTTSRMSITSLLQVPMESSSSESPSPATVGRDCESTIPLQSNSPPTTVSPPAKRQKIASARATSTLSHVEHDSHATQPTGENPEDLPDYDSLIEDWDKKAARVVNAHTNIQENRKALSEQSKYVAFLEHMHRTHPPDEDGRKHYEDEKKKLGDIQFLHGIFLRGFEEAKRAAVVNADPDVTLAEQARRMGRKRRREVLTH
ncbi:hypothetical protein FIE12Z_10692 [Fusarium flagelliforme]|uniref:Uncharacterized protein n=1 Tax=Fusarium flagelliforme TaxID=2675880 RepID=A0A395MB12_9HYPO|nr:hypothetical protein FIE12Z_10692 [Fusarium flagelliforme]